MQQATLRSGYLDRPREGDAGSSCLLARGPSHNKTGMCQSREIKIDLPDRNAPYRDTTEGKPHHHLLLRGGFVRLQLADGPLLLRAELREGVVGPADEGVLDRDHCERRRTGTRSVGSRATERGPLLFRAELYERVDGPADEGLFDRGCTGAGSVGGRATEGGPLLLRAELHEGVVGCEDIDLVDIAHRERRRTGVGSVGGRAIERGPLLVGAELHKGVDGPADEGLFDRGRTGAESVCGRATEGGPLLLRAELHGRVVGCEDIHLVDRAHHERRRASAGSVSGRATERGTDAARAADVRGEGGRRRHEGEEHVHRLHELLAQHDGFVDGGVGWFIEYLNFNLV